MDNFLSKLGTLSIYVYVISDLWRVGRELGKGSERKGYKDIVSGLVLSGIIFLFVASIIQDLMSSVITFFDYYNLAILGFAVSVAGFYGGYSLAKNKMKIHVKDNRLKTTIFVYVHYTTYSLAGLLGLAIFSTLFIILFDFLQRL